MFRARRDTLGRMHRRWALGTVLTLAVVAAACGSDPADDGTTSSPARGGTSASPDAPTPVLPDVLDFEAPLLGGGTLDGESLAGRDVAFWFWAPW